MEINDLKTIWKKANDQNTAGYWVSDRDIRAMLKNKSNATIADVLRQMRYKIRLSGVIGGLTMIVALAHLFFIDNEELFFFSFSTMQYGVMMLFMSTSILTISIHTWYRHKQVSTLQQKSQSLKHSLGQTKKIFKKLILTNVLTDSVAVPVVLVAGMALRFYSKEPFNFDIRLLYLLLAAITSFIALFSFAKFKMKRKLGGFINALNSRLKELEAFESD